MDYLQELVTRYPQLMDNRSSIEKAYHLILDAYKENGKLLIAGNGGSAADAGHITGELMKGLVKKRPPSTEFKYQLKQVDLEVGSYLGESLQGGLPAIDLGSHSALVTAIGNDIDGNVIYAQQIYAYGNPEDIFLGISTSGNSKNILNAIITSKAKSMKTIALLGASGGIISKYADLSIIVPETETYKIQELHLPIYHTICLMLEEYFFL